MDLGLKDKVAWVLGGSSGLGRASAFALAAEGAQVAVSSRDSDKLHKAASEIEEKTGSRCSAHPLDVSDRKAIPQVHEAIAGDLGPVEILVANAGGPPPGGFDALDEAAMFEAFKLTTASAWRLSKLVVPAMRERGAGSIIFLTSSTTREIMPTLLLSNMMRAAVVGMAKTMSKEFGKDGIRVLCVAPGRIETPRLQALERAAAERTNRSIEEVRAEVQSNIPLGRYGSPDEFGSVVAFLASDQASYVSGITVGVDGGLLDSLLS